MRIYAIAVGSRAPAWVRDGFEEYARRMPGHCRLELIEVPAPRRSRGADVERLVREEGRRVLAAVPGNSRVVALSREGTPRSTPDVADAMRQWLASGRNAALLIGGAEGLAEPCLARADEVWSLSRLTLGYPVVRIVLAEQLYRAWSIVAGLPYHRGKRSR